MQIRKVPQSCQSGKRWIWILEALSNTNPSKKAYSTIYCTNHFWVPFLATRLTLEWQPLTRSCSIRNSSGRPQHKQDWSFLAFACFCMYVYVENMDWIMIFDLTLKKSAAVIIFRNSSVNYVSFPSFEMNGESILN